MVLQQVPEWEGIPSHHQRHISTVEHEDRILSGAEIKGTHTCRYPHTHSLEKRKELYVTRQTHGMYVVHTQFHKRTNL